mmetsp:Transcript_42304/g.127864  ORF Transcript_42304/g.127864 Transcript_42304/m.127864 type:complete len:283 (-) Transcript_42304:736-1584(-)
MLRTNVSPSCVNDDSGWSLATDTATEGGSELAGITHVATAAELISPLRPVTMYRPLPILPRASVVFWSSLSFAACFFFDCRSFASCRPDASNMARVFSSEPPPHRIAGRPSGMPVCCTQRDTSESTGSSSAPPLAQITSLWSFGLQLAKMLPTLVCAAFSPIGGAKITITLFRWHASTTSKASTAFKSCISTSTSWLVRPYAKDCAKRSLSPWRLTQKTHTDGPSFVVASSDQLLYLPIHSSLLSTRTGPWPVAMALTSPQDSPTFFSALRTLRAFGRMRQL